MCEIERMWKSGFLTQMRKTHSVLNLYYDMVGCTHFTGTYVHFFFIRYNVAPKPTLV